MTLLLCRSSCDPIGIAKIMHVAGMWWLRVGEIPTATYRSREEAIAGFYRSWFQSAEAR